VDSHPVEHKIASSRFSMEIQPRTLFVLTNLHFCHSKQVPQDSNEPL
jgi:hypothetical protein